MLSQPAVMVLRGCSAAMVMALLVSAQALESLTKTLRSDPDSPADRQVLGGESPLYVATDSDNRTALEPIVKAFPQVGFQVGV